MVSDSGADKRGCPYSIVEVDCTTFSRQLQGLFPTFLRECEYLSIAVRTRQADVSLGQFGFGAENLREGQIPPLSGLTFFREYDMMHCQ